METWIRRLHLLCLAFWTLITPIAIIFWANSVLFVIICSLFANIYASMAAYQGARTEKKQEEDANS